MLDIPLHNLVENIPQYKDSNNISVDVLRLDKIDAEISGNKWFKLKYYLAEAIAVEAKQIITYGGVWSNHIAATAAACKQLNIPCKVIVRSDEGLLTSTLELATANGATLEYATRKSYATEKIKSGISSNGDYHIPEGGADALGVKGAATILAFDTASMYSHLIVSIGTGTTFAGIVKGAKSHQQVLGISAVKPQQLYDDVLSLAKQINVSIITDYHFGGFAKYDITLIDFMNAYYKTSNIPTDIVYTGKLFYAVNDLIAKKYFEAKSKILIIHSGGLQGNISLTNNALIF